MTVPTAPVDPDMLAEKLATLRGFGTGFNQVLMVYIGVELGLYQRMAGAGPITAAELAGSLGLHERFVLEWLRAGAAGGLLEYHDDDHFSAAPEVGVLLGNEESLMSVRFVARSLAERVAYLPRTIETFRTGVGLDWDDRGPEAIVQMEEGFGPWHRLALVPAALPALDGVVAQLKAGARVADYGCGPGIALIEMAKAFPASEFHGYELSRNAIARAETNAAAAGVTNAAFHCVLDEALPVDGRFSLVTTFDVMHDTSHPEAVATRIRASLRGDGCWFIAEIKQMPTFAENLASNPLAALQYPISVLLCLQSSMSSPDDVGYGSYGLPEPAMRELALAAGFTRFRVVDLPSPVNAFYEVRP